MDLGLAGRAYVVTGASRGLGRACAQVLADEGARVVVGARDPEAVEAAAQAVGGTGVQADLGDPAAGQRLVDACRAAYGGVDGALVSVGGPPPGASLELSDVQWTSAFETVFLGAVRVCRAVAAALPPEGGAIALVLSSSVRVPLAGLAASNGLRPGLAMLAKTMADELGPRGVRVNGLLPGRIATDRLRQIEGDDEAARARSLRAIPLGRNGTPEEFARVAAFLLSPAASYVSGTMVAVDGGMTRSL